MVLAGMVLRHDEVEFYLRGPPDLGDVCTMGQEPLALHGLGGDPVDVGLEIGVG